MLLYDVVTRVYDGKDVGDVFEGLDLAQHMDLLKVLGRVFAIDPENMPDKGKLFAIPYEDGKLVRVVYINKRDFVSNYRPVSLAPLDRLEPGSVDWEREVLRLYPMLKDAHDRLPHAPIYGEAALERILGAVVGEPVTVPVSELVKACVFPFAGIPVPDEAPPSELRKAAAAVAREKALRTTYEYFAYYANLGCNPQAIALAKQLLAESTEPLVIRSHFSANHQEALRHLMPEAKAATIVRGSHLDTMSPSRLRELGMMDTLFILDFTTMEPGGDGEDNLEALIDRGVRLMAFFDRDEEVSVCRNDAVYNYLASAKEVILDKEREI